MSKANKNIPLKKVTELVNKTNQIDNLDLDDDSDVESIKTFKSLSDIQFRTESQSKYWKIIGDKEITFCTGPAGTGKAQPLYSKVLTPDGWQKIGSLKEGDYVVSPKGNKSKIIEIHDFDEEMKVYEIEFSDGRTSRCSENHLWKIYNYDWTYKWKIITTKELIELMKIKRKNLYIQLVDIKDVNIDLPLNPYLLGLLIGNGELTSEMPVLTTSEDEIVENVENIVDNYGCKISELSSKFGYGIVMKNRIVSGKKGVFTNQIKNILNELNLYYKKSEDKFIPEIYKSSSLEQKKQLLRGLIDSAGYVDKYGSITYSTSSEKLANDVKNLIYSIGGISYITFKKSGYINSNDKYIEELGAFCVHIKYKNPKELVSLKRKNIRISDNYQYSDLKLKIKNVKYIENDKCRCITIDDSEQLYITDNYIVTHNSYISLAKALQIFSKERKKYKKIILVKPAVEAEENLGFLPGSVEDKLAPYVFSSKYLLYKLLGKQKVDNLVSKGKIEIMALSYIRGINIDNSIVIVEEAQNMTKRSMKTLLTRIGENSKYIISGDLQQQDLKLKGGDKNGLLFSIERLGNIPEIGIFEFSDADIVRNPVISKILKEFNGDV